MAIIKERVYSLINEYSFDEILYAYSEIKHNMSLSKEAKNYYKNYGKVLNIECIAVELSRIYLGSDVYADRFVSPAITINKSFDNIEIKNLSKIIPEDIKKRCINIANEIKENN